LPLIRWLIAAATRLPPPLACLMFRFDAVAAAAMPFSAPQNSHITIFAAPLDYAAICCHA